MVFSNDAEFINTIFFYNEHKEKWNEDSKGFKEKDKILNKLFDNIVLQSISENH